ncbi:MAG TPA: sulfate transporter [Candidatus Omnitrophica bacterium]|nr:sulfate transporter [Candidatus Omnitrophota bacterium]
MNFIHNNIKSFKFNISEIAGSLGDMGIFIPLFVGLVTVCGLSPANILIFSGLFSVLSAMLFGIPIAVQPMKAIAIIAIAERLSPNQIFAAGLVTGFVVFLLGITNIISHLNKMIPKSVVRGLQLGLGLKLVITGIQMVANTNTFFGYDSISIGIISMLLVLVFLFSKRFPGALVVCGLGIILVFLKSPHIFKELNIGFAVPRFIIPGKSDFIVGVMRASIAQIPLTLLNSVIAVCALSWDLFPKKGVNPRGIAISVGLMNLIGCWFGAMPMCHGAGGLAAQYRFGARTGGSVFLLGIVKIFVGLLFGAACLKIFSAYPVSVLGILLLFAGFELAVVSRDMVSKTDFFVMFLTAATTLALKSIAIGFAIGLIFSYLFIFGIVKIEKLQNDMENKI